MPGHPLIYCIFPLILCAGSAFVPDNSSAGVDHLAVYARGEFIAFADQAARLESAIDHIDRNNPKSVELARSALWSCRVQYKRISFFLDYFFSFSAQSFNSPPQFELEEPSMEYDEPLGLQVIEDLLFDDDPASRQEELRQQAAFVASSAADLRALLYGFHADDSQLMESVRLELIRVLTLTLAGWDAPLLKSGIAESHASLSAMASVLGPYLANDDEAARSLSLKLDSVLSYLTLHTDFDSFDRTGFLTSYGLPLLKSFDRFIGESGLSNVNSAVPFDAGLFSGGALPEGAFCDTSDVSTPAMIALGQSLFFDKRLSGDESRSCATCHQPGRYFTDGLARSIALDGESSVPRNAPTLLYASFQHRQFWDGRVKTLEEQTATVLSNALEMNATPQVVVAALSRDSVRMREFRKAFADSDSVISLDHIVRSIAAFVRTLHVFDSPFDRYFKGDRKAMTPSQVRGFNLFMGKAQCGTCHFPPLFNGLTPPRYDITEFESIGVPASQDLDSPSADDDQGRFAVYKIPFQRGFFKTPTLRNVAMTAPYMHNGSFTSLESVVDFYDRGGGAGIGLALVNQSLSSRPLNLTAQEKADIIEFLRALTDPAPTITTETIKQPNP